MIKKLRLQFILTTMACIGFLFVLILGVINISMTISSRNQGYVLLERIFERTKAGEGEQAGEGITAGEPVPAFPDRLSPPGYAGGSHPAEREDGGFGRRGPRDDINFFDLKRSFFVTCGMDGTITALSYDENSGLTDAFIRELAEKVLENGTPQKERGVVSGYLYLYQETEGEGRLCFLDYTPERTMSLRLFWTCLWIGLIGMLFLLAVVTVLSRFLIRPVQNAFEKQKTFIADASHELKTPLTIIRANADVLSAELPGSKWLSNILAQTGRMNELIKDLLELAKLDACPSPQPFSAFDLSKAVKTAALSFESVAYEHGCELQLQITDGIRLTGDEKGIRQLVTILLDNAFQYTEKSGCVTLSLTSRKDKIQLSVHNTGKGISKEDQRHIFERFYRSDASRSRNSGGYGLGLSIAAAIVKTHRGHIGVKSDARTYTRFTVTF